jgi:hypothetical protein
MHTGRNALAIVGAEPLVPTRYVENGRTELLVEGFGEGFPEPFQTRRWRSIFEGNYNQRVTDIDLADCGASRRGALLGTKRLGEK